MMRGVMFIVILSFESEGRKFTRLYFAFFWGEGVGEFLLTFEGVP